MNEEERKLKARLYYQEHKEEVKKRSRERARRWRSEAPEEVKEYNKLEMRAWRLRIKIKVLSHYGKEGKPVCVRCGEDRLPCLSIDHIDGRGREDRRNRGKVGNGLYSQLIREGFPSGFQTLCMNCQWVKRFENNENC